MDPMERVSSSPDMLSLILSNVDRSTQARSARVCRNWFDPAVRNLWNSLGSIVYLLRLLPSVDFHRKVLGHHYDGSILCYEARSKGDWERFDVYKKFVRKLVLRCAQGGVIHETLSTLAYTSSVTSLLPNLSELTIHSGPYLLDSLFFLHRGLQRVIINDIEDMWVHRLLGHVLPRLSSVRSLRLFFKGDPNASHYEEPFKLAFQEMIRLEELVISQFNVTQDMMLCIASMPELKLLHCYTPQNPIYKGTITNPSPEKVTSGQFSWLETVCLQTSMATISSFLSLGQNFSNIKELDLEITDMASEASLRKMCEYLALDWYSLSTFLLKICEGLKEDNKTKTLTFDTFCHLSSLRQMKIFSFYYVTPLKIDDSNMEVLTQNWPLLEELSISFDTEKGYRKRPTLTIFALELLAHHCKNLRRLRLYLDATNADDLEPTPVMMEKLASVTFGLSSIKDSETVAIYLSQFLPTSCHINQEQRVKSADGEEDNRIEVLEGYRKKWRNMSRTLQTIQKAFEKQRKNVSSHLNSSQIFHTP